MQLVWAENVVAHTGGPSSSWSPLAVTFQTEAEAEKFGIEAGRLARRPVAEPDHVTNYERLHHFEPRTSLARLRRVEHPQELRRRTRRRS
jgi:hypothetical protein